MTKETNKIDLDAMYVEACNLEAGATSKREAELAQKWLDTIEYARHLETS